MKTYPFLALALSVLLSACAFDNYDEPESVLEGRVVYDDQPLSVRQNAIQLELWQSGYAEREYIPVMVHQDGTFRAVLFDGDYKLVRRQNNGPWVNNPDTIFVTVKGNKALDVPVEPYYMISSASITRAGGTINATATVQQVAGGRAIERVVLVVGKNQFVDTRFNNGRTDVEGAAVTAGSPVTLSRTLGDLAGEPYVFARVGVKVVGVEELIYTTAQKI